MKVINAISKVGSYTFAATMLIGVFITGFVWLVGAAVASVGYRNASPLVRWRLKCWRSLQKIKVKKMLETSSMKELIEMRDAMMTRGVNFDNNTCVQYYVQAVRVVDDELEKDSKQSYVLRNFRVYPQLLDFYHLDKVSPRNIQGLVEHFKARGYVAQSVHVRIADGKFEQYRQR